MHLLNLVNSVVTVVWFVAFVALCLWAWSRRRHADFAAAARLAVDDTPQHPAARDDAGSS